MSPQLLRCEKYSYKCDVWALGFVFFQMLFGKTPWAGASQIKLLENIKGNPLSFPSNVKVSDESKDLIKKMLAYDEDSRISAADLFKHPFINLKTPK